jgi:hypothetical protein
LDNLRQEVYQTRSFNEMLSQENDELRMEIDRLRSAPESEEESRPIKRQRTKAKGKRPVRNSGDDEPEEEEDADARVRLKIFLQCTN